MVDQEIHGLIQYNAIFHFLFSLIIKLFKKTVYAYLLYFRHYGGPCEN